MKSLGIVLKLVRQPVPDPEPPMPADSLNDEDEWAREQAEEEVDRLRKEEPAPKISEAEFLAWRSPRIGTANPTRLDNPLWHWLVRTRWDGYSANNVFGGPSPFTAGPMWCFQRYGMSETTLEDGRVLYIGGEHEDHYDPDFCIYNDVTVVDAAGSIAIHGYPKENFPPTDFHSATQIGSAIYIVGRLGYAESRALGVTPVFKLSLDSMQMEAVETLGESPGWIYKHQAALASDGHTLVISGGVRWRGEQRAIQENVDTWALDTRNGRWTRLTQHHWQHWVMWRVDRKRNRLWDTRQAQWHQDHAHLGLENDWRHSEPPDFAALEALYRLPGETSPVIEESEYGVFSTEIDGLKVRFKESNGFLVEAIVEGQLRPDRLHELQRTTLVLLEQIDASPYEIEVADGP